MSKNPLKLKALLIDLNGTLHLGSEPTKGAVQAIEKLRKAKIPFIFCSNSTKESSNHLLYKLGELGFKAEKEELMTSLSACKQLVEKRELKYPYLLMSDSAKEEFSSLPSSSSSSSSSNQQVYDSVILGLDPPSLSYEGLNKAFRILKNEAISSSISDNVNDNGSSQKAVLIAPHKSLYQQTPATEDLPEGLSLGIGPFVTLLEEASGEKAHIVGKPTKSFFELAIERLKSNNGIPANGLEKSDIGVIGDDINNDLGGGARELGLKRILVRTGKYRKDSEKTEYPPDKTYGNFAEFVDDLI
ncbi:TIGR01458 family HAD hydrolase [Kwoniella dendrophila CBS 6074]|uniref:TIGR01458 family HAD hydrolase n=1 Tax=Kwoniella dendrophila CBS 6074 TaxID=1295534 RepID=A0AAX4JTB7_9TREE